MAHDASTPRAAEPPAKAQLRKPAGTSVRTVVFADITGSNALYNSLGDMRAMSIITRCLVALEEQVYQHRGEVIKTIGEEMLSVFTDANAAAAAVIAMQQRMEHFAADVSLPLSLRVGLHSGPVIEEHGDVFGDSVNVAARLVKLAAPGQILSDSGSLAAMRATFRRRARALDRRRVRGRSAEIEIVELGWRRTTGEPFTTEQGTVLEGSGKARMLLRAEGQEYALDGTRATFTIGRDQSNDLPIASRKASRQHARIEWRRDKFVLFDHSTNGTYVTVEGEREVLVKHESFVLRSRGVLSIGEPVSARGRGTLQFECR